MRPMELDHIITGVVQTVHNQTDADRQPNTDCAVHTIIRGAKVLSAINRAMTMAVRFIESDGQSTMRPTRGMVQ